MRLDKQIISARVLLPGYRAEPLADAKQVHDISFGFYESYYGDSVEDGLTGENG